MARRPISKTQLRSFAPARPVPTTPTEVMINKVSAQKNANATQRRHFGRAISMDRIELALRSAHNGSMRDLTDLSRETIDTDPHLASVLAKRFGALSSLPWEVVPASGFGVDIEKAKFYANVVTEQLKSLSNLRRALYNLAWGLFDGRSAIEMLWVPVLNGMSASYGRVSLAVSETNWIHPRRLSFGPTRDLRVNDEIFEGLGGFSNYGMPLESVPYKFAYWTPQLFGEYPEREGLSPRCLYWSFFKRFGARERMILMELFGKPWRIIEVDEDFQGSDDDLANADTTIDNLGAAFTARLPRGLKVQVVQPGTTAGAVHKDVIAESDKQISKLVLGQSATTDAVPAGMNNSTANVMQDEQLMILTRDARELSEIIETFISDAIIAVNFGQGEVAHAPHFTLRSDLPISRQEELERLNKALTAGMSISMSEAYEVSGFRVPHQDEAIIRIEQPPTAPNSPVAPAPRAIIVFPPGLSPAVGEQQPAPATAGQEAGSAAPSAMVGAPDSTKTITVNEDRAARQLPPLELPTGGLDPDGNLTIDEFTIKRATTFDDENQAPTSAGAPASAVSVAPPGTAAVDPKQAMNGAQVAALLSIVEQVATRALPRASGIAAMIAAFPLTSAQAEEIMGEVGITFFAGDSAAADASTAAAPVSTEDTEPPQTDAIASLLGMDPMMASALRASVITARALQAQTLQLRHTQCGVCEGVLTLAKDHEQPSTENGSPETLLDKALAEVRPVMAKLAAKFEAALEGKETAATIYGSLAHARASLDVRPLARALERRMVQCAALGALDGALDTDSDDVQAAAPKKPKPGADFSRMPFADALRVFRARNVIQRHLFDKLEAAAKTKAFTVAGVTADQMLGTIHDELVKQVAAGADLREFRKFVSKRMEDSGFVASLKPLADGSQALSASHVETVFRTNTLGAYNAGRHAQMSDPEVVRRRPVWEIRGIGDTRTRDTHAAAHGKRLLASDPFWKTAYPPFGFNCYLPDTQIQGQIIGASRALYTGKVVELTTAVGRRLTVTANHPVLTPKGLIPACELSEGDELLSYGDQSWIATLGQTAQGYEHEQPAQAEQVFSALAQTIGSARSRYGADDFHGEARFFHDEIDVVGTYRDLSTKVQATLDKKFTETVLESPNSLSTADVPSESVFGASVETAFAASDSSMGSSDLSSPILAGHVAPLHKLSLGAASNLNTVLPEQSSESDSRYSEFVSELIDRSTGEVTIDHVSQVRHYDWSGHVYDFETSTGWLVADGVLASNCRCRVVARKDIEGLTTGDAISGLPDPGFTSGIGSLI